MADGEADQIAKPEAAGLLTTQPDLAPFRALKEPAYQRIADYAGADNAGQFRDIVDQARKDEHASPMSSIGENPVDLMILPLMLDVACVGAFFLQSKPVGIGRSVFCGPPSRSA